MEEAHISMSEREMLVSALAESRDATVAAAGSLSDEQWTFRSGEKCWTIGENVEHLITVERNIFGLVKKVLSRPPSVNWHESTAGKEELLQSVLLDRTQKREAPEAVQPTGRLDRAFTRNAGTNFWTLLQQPQNHSRLIQKTIDAQPLVP